MENRRRLKRIRATINNFADSTKAKVHQEQTKELRDAFDLFDKDGDGRITSDELMSVMRTLRQTATEAEIREMIQNVDTDGEGGVSFASFCACAAAADRKLRHHAGAEMREAFAIFDADRDGFVVDADIRRTMAALGEPVSDEDVRHMIREADRDRDGKINYPEFVAMMEMRISNSMDALDGDAALSTEQRSELRLVFSLFDKDRDQNISIDEVTEVMGALRQDFNRQRLRENFDRVDLDGNGLIDFGEFVRLLETSAGRRRCPAAELRALFTALDRDANGHVDAAELRAAMGGVGVTLSDADVTLMLRTASDDNRIYYEDFVRMMTGVIGQSQKKMMSSLGRDDSYTDRLSIDENGDTVLEIEESKVAFAMFDKDGDGVITCSELLQVMTSLGINIDSDEVKDIVKKIDLDDDGVIEFDEFQSWMREHSPPAPDRASSDDDELNQLFRIFDKDGDGCICAADLRSTMKDLGLVLTRDDVAAMMKQVGLGADGKILHEDFRKIMEPLMQTNSRQPADENKRSTSHDDSELRVMFAEFDADRDGRVGLADVRRILSSLGYHVTTGALKSRFSKLDVNGNGLINCREFLILAKDIAKKHRKEPHSNAHAHADHVTADDAPAGPFYPSTSDLTSLGGACSQTSLGGACSKTSLGGASSQTSLGGACSQTSLGGSQPDAKTTTASPSPRIQVQDREDAGGVTCAEMTNYAQLTPSRSEPTKANAPSTIKQAVPEPDVWRAFKTFDLDRNGYVSRTELRTATVSLGLSYTDAEIDAMMMQADTNGDGRIDYREFIRMMQTNDVIKQAVNISVKPTTSLTAQTPEVTSAAAIGGQRVVAGLSGRPANGHCVTELPRCRNARDTHTMTDPEKIGKISSISPLLRRLSDALKTTTVEPTPAHSDLSNAIAGSKLEETPEMLDSSSCLLPSELGTSLLTASSEITATINVDLSADSNQGGNGSVEFNEFLRMMQQSRDKNPTKDGRRVGLELEMWTAFKVFDIDGNGLIDQLELRETMRNLGEELSDRDLQAMMTVADMNRDGKIDYEEFIRMMYTKT